MALIVGDLLQSLQMEAGDNPPNPMLHKKERRNAYNREWYKKNRDRCLAKHKEWKRNNPDKVRAYARNISDRVRQNRKKWMSNNEEKVKGYFRKSRKKCRKELKDKVINAYGGKCVCCNESNKEFLTIDHINGNGKEHRKQFTNTTQIYRELERLGWPKDNYRLLCMNCNWSRGLHGYCPHERTS